MSCFPCFRSRKSNSNKELLPGAFAHATRDISVSPSTLDSKQRPSAEVKNRKDEGNAVDSGNIAAQTFTFRELASATKNFRQECLLGEGGFGRVYKGTLQPSGQVVAVKQLDRNGVQSSKEFLVEVLMLSLLNHPNLVKLIGYCADGDQRLLVYEYMQLGSLEDYLYDTSPDKKPLDWPTRMKIASGTAQGMEYLHEKANPPVIYRDLKSSNILLDEEFNPRLCDFGLAKLGLGGNKRHVSPRVMGTYGYCAPEYERTGELTLKSDIYSFGVILLELITGRRAIDTTRPPEEQNLVAWVQPFFRDPKRFPEMADPFLNKKFPERSLNQAVGVAAMCLQDEASVRPLISDVVAALSFLAVVSQDADIPSTTTILAPTPSSELKISNEHNNHQDNGGISSHQGNENHNDEEYRDHKDRGNPEYEYDDNSESSDREDGDSEDECREITKSKKWTSRSARKSKADSCYGSIGSSSLSSSRNSIESHDRSVSKNSRSNSNTRDQ